MLGFRHLVDNVIQRVLSSMRPFPDFLAKLKCITRFLRSDLNLSEIARCLERDGFGGLAAVVRKISIPSLAAWRWGTIAEVTRVLSSFLASLIAHFDPKAFEDSKDTTDVKAVLAAFRSPSWLRMFELVTWYTGKLSTLMDWAGGCPCHSKGDAGAGQCHLRGRRLAEAYDKVSKVLGEMLEQAQQWEASDFAGDANFWKQAQGMVRFTYAYGIEKASFFNKIPYLLVRLPEAWQACLASPKDSIVSTHGPSPLIFVRA